MSSSSVEKIKERLDIAEIVGSYVKLEKAGGNLKGKCPFHNEKTPSFFVSPGRGTYYCFGCGAKGDIFTFVQEFEGVDFIGALKMLAERAGVTLDHTESPQSKSEKEELFQVLENATRYFEKNLAQSKEALEYVRKRGLSDETIQKWRIGYSLPEWRHLTQYFAGEKINHDLLLKAGLIKKSDKAKQDGVYDVFRGRIMFPIFDASGRVIAFSGRIFDEIPDAPKYLNSPETDLFNKSETLHGLDKAKIAIRKKDYSILVEGQMDLLMCHQSGFDNTVASSGTAFTEAHLLKLKRISNRILFVFDADSAGFEAAKKSAHLGLSLGMEVKLAQLPEGTDPADLILSDIEGWNKAIKQSKHFIDFYLDVLIERKLDHRQLAKEIEKKIIPFIVLLKSSIEQSHFISQIAKKTGIREEAIWTDVRNAPHKVLVSQDEKEDSAVSKETEKRRNYIERRLYGLLFWQEGELAKKIDTDKLRLELVRIVGDRYVVEGLRTHSNNKDELIFEAESYYGGMENLNRDIEELLVNFEEDVLREKFVESMNNLDKAEKHGDTGEVKELLALCQSITNQLALLSQKRRAL